MPKLLFVSHPEVVVDPDVPITQWGLTDLGRARAAAFAASDQFAAVSRIWSSAERKARETADLLAAPRNLPVQIDPRLGENDRSATGYLPPAEFEATADAFFANPEKSIRGWERAIDAQTRVETVIREIAAAQMQGDLAISSHGAVGTSRFLGEGD